MQAQETTFERHYSIDELASIWGVSDDDYRRRADPWPLNPAGELLLGIKIKMLFDIAAREMDMDPVELRRRVFTKFWTTGDSGGSGLGLSISRDLTRAHGGDLHLLRTGPDGTAIRIEIPDSSLSQHGYVTLRSKG